MSKPLALTANIVSVALTALIFIYVSRSTSYTQPFFYHPILMGVAFVLMMTQGVLILTANVHFFKLAGEGKRKTKVAVHFWLQVAAALLYTIAFGAIVYNKNAKCAEVDGPCNLHFKTWHSWVGMAALVLSWIQVFGGVYLYYRWPKIALSIVLNPPQDITVKKLHRISGAMGFALSMLTIVLGTYSSYATTYIPREANVLICALSSLLMIAIIPLSVRLSVPAWLQ